MATYQIQILLLVLLLLYQPLEILFTRKRHGICNVNSFSWTLLLSLFSVSTLPQSLFQNTYDVMVLIVILLLGLMTILVINKTISGNSFKVSDVSGVNLSVVLKKARVCNRRGDVVCFGDYFSFRRIKQQDVA